MLLAATLGSSLIVCKQTRITEPYITGCLLLHATIHVVSRLVQVTTWVITNERARIGPGAKSYQRVNKLVRFWKQTSRNASQSQKNQSPIIMQKGGLPFCWGWDCALVSAEWLWILCLCSSRQPTRSLREQGPGRGPVPRANATRSRGISFPWRKWRKSRWWRPTRLKANTSRDFSKAIQQLLANSPLEKLQFNSKFKHGQQSFD